VYLWADAICVNQEDIPERNSQVRLMREVYSTATEVVARVGEVSELDSVCALVRMEQLRQRFREAPEAILTSTNEGGPSDIPDDPFNSIPNLLLQPCFGRA